MKKEEKFIKTASYPGGRKALSDFIRHNLRYPKKALENETEGVVVVVIDINDKGDVIRGRIKKRLGQGCDEEALRVCKLLKFKSVKNYKRKVIYHRTMNVQFKLPKKLIKENQSVKAPPKMTITYTYVPKKK